jgi:pimeloyl-ACP methyl ester carboxylesterase
VTAPALTGRRLEVNGLGLNVFDSGTGRPMLLLHGFPDSLRLWRDQVQPLVTAGFRVIALDQRGFGLSDAPADRRSYDLPLLGADALGVLDELGVTEPAVVVGHDWGAVVGWYLAATHPHRVDRLVAISVGHPRATLDAGLRQLLRASYILLFRTPGVAELVLRAGDFALIRRLLRNEKDLPLWLADLRRPGRLTAGLNWYRMNARRRRAELPAVHAPVMAIWSDGERATTERQLKLSRRYVTGSFRYVRIEGAGHWIPRDAPGRLTELLIDFCRVEARAATG